MSELEQTLGNATVAGAATDEMIKAAEEVLSVRFPQQYRSFLKTYGAAMGAGFEIAGVFNEDDDGPPMWRDVIKATQRFRKSVNGTLPDTLIPIADDGCGVDFYVDASNEHECNVIAYGPGVDGKTVAHSFEEFVLRIARDELNV